MPINSFIPNTGLLSAAWARAFLEVMKPGVTRVAPLVVTVAEFKDEVPVEDDEIRNRLDTELAKHGLKSVATVANTLFPSSLWNPDAEANADRLYERYERIWSRIRRDNTRGGYFRRLTAYQPKGRDGEAVNQLAHIVETYHRGVRRGTALQAGVVDPTRDHLHTRRLGFPCLHQVSFTPDSEELIVTGYYGSQYLVQRAYGNFLGLCRLGRFMADQMGLSLVRMTCVAGTAVRDSNLRKQDVQGLADDLREILGEE